MDTLFFHLLVMGASILVLVYSGDQFVYRSGQLAEHFDIPKLFIGTIVVGFATSVPEIMVTLVATQTGRADIAIGNAIGSYISNISLVVGLTALIKPLQISMAVLRKELPLLAAALTLTIYLVIDGHLSPNDGYILIVFFFAFLGYTIHYMREHEEELSPLLISKEKNVKTKTSIILSWFSVHLILLLTSSYYIVEAATNIAEILNLSEMLIGLSIVAVGTSLPELTTTLVSVWKKEDDIAIGNIIGSNVFCILFILGLAIVTTPQGINTEKLWPEFLIMIISTTCLWLFSAKFDNVCQINRLEGGVLFILFIIYLLLVITLGH